MAHTAEVAVAVRRTAQEALHTALSKLSSPLALTPGKQAVIIKPSIYDPEMVGNTTLGMVQSAVSLFSSAAKVFIVESNNPLRTAEAAFAKSGYDRLQKESVKLLNLTSCPTALVSMRGHYFQTHPMPTILTENPFLVNIATVKVEPEICVLGAGIKNLFGLIPETDKAQYHTNIDPILLDLLHAFRPDLTVIDLTRLVVGSREDGKDIHIGGVAVSTDPVAVDAYCADLLGLDPLKISHLKLAYDAGLGEALIDGIRVVGTEHQKKELARLVNSGKVQH